MNSGADQPKFAPVHDVQDLFRDLGLRVTSAWAARNWSQQSFPAVAAEAIQATRDLPQLSERTLTNFVLGTDELPFQQHFEDEFGEPSVTAFWHSAFYIELLFWSTATPAIHNHAFRGAFTHLVGSSLHTRYRFNTTERVSDILAIGELETTDIEQLHPGDVRLIEPNTLTHAVFHLGSPSITLVIRTHSDLDRSGRFVYYPPHVAYDSSKPDQIVSRQLAVLRLLGQTDPSMYAAHSIEAIDKGNLYIAFMILRDLFLLVRPSADVAKPIVAKAASKWGIRAKTIVQSLVEHQRQSVAPQLRARVRAPRLRLFLGLVLGQQSWPPIAAAITKIIGPSDASQFAADCIAELAALEALPFVFSDDDRRKCHSLIGTELDLKGTDADHGTFRLRSALIEASFLRPLFTPGRVD